MILDNSTTGMTGHQDHAATGKTLQGDPTYAIDIPALCRAIGVKNVIEVNAFDIELSGESRSKKKWQKMKFLSLLQKHHVYFLSKKKKPLYAEEPDKCKKCGMCMKPGCPAMTKKCRRRRFILMIQCVLDADLCKRSV